VVAQSLSKVFIDTAAPNTRTCLQVHRSGASLRECAVGSDAAEMRMPNDACLVDAEQS